MGNVVGISCYYHDSAVAVLRDGRVVAAAQEERFDRDKYSAVFPLRALNDCLQRAELSPLDIDRVAFYEKPFLKLGRVMVGHLVSWPFSFPNFQAMMPAWLEDRLSLPLTLKEHLEFDGPVHFVKHHLSHASASYFGSPYDEAALLTVDGIGEWASASWGWAEGTRVRVEAELRYPNSLGLLYSIVCTYLGFQVFTGEGKVMALGAFGEPTMLDRFLSCIQLRDDGSFRLDPSYFALNRGRRMYSRRFVELFGPPRGPDDALEQRHYDMAASLQAFAERALLAMARHVHARTGKTRLCAAGGVFLNVLANTRILEETPFEDLFILPAAGDAGAAMGAASWVHHALMGGERAPPVTHAYLGPDFSDDKLRRVLIAAGATFEELETPELCQRVAGFIAEGHIVAWYQGRMEFGPRALGARSLLADPRRADMKDVLNDRVKHREPFRPYGVSVLEEESPAWFGLDHPSPFMLLVGQVRPDKRERIPAAVHVDGSSRIQTVDRSGQPPRYRALIEAFHRLTGVPMVINTSFNVQEPIVCTPEEAWATFDRADMDHLVMGPFLVSKGAGRAGAAAGAWEG
jgi:carbamoyltransferase